MDGWPIRFQFSCLLVASAQKASFNTNFTHDLPIMHFKLHRSDATTDIILWWRKSFCTHIDIYIYICLIELWKPMEQNLVAL